MPSSAGRIWKVLLRRARSISASCRCTNGLLTPSGGKDTQRDNNKHHYPTEYAKRPRRNRIVGQRSDWEGPIPYVLPKQA